MREKYLPELPDRSLSTAFILVVLSCFVFIKPLKDLLCWTDPCFGEREERDLIDRTRV